MPDLRFMVDLFRRLDSSMAALSSPIHTHPEMQAPIPSRRQIRNGNPNPVVLPLILLPRVNTSSISNSTNRLPRLPSHIRPVALGRTLRPLVKPHPIHINSSTALPRPINLAIARAIRLPQASSLPSIPTLETHSLHHLLDLRRVTPLLASLTSLTTLSSRAKHHITRLRRLRLLMSLHIKLQARVKFPIIRLRLVRRPPIQTPVDWTISSMKVNEGLLRGVCAKISINMATSCAVIWLARSINIRIA